MLSDAPPLKLGPHCLKKATESGCIFEPSDFSPSSAALSLWKTNEFYGVSAGAALDCDHGAYLEQEIHLQRTEHHIFSFFACVLAQ
jgi:hypothetical protein